MSSEANDGFLSVETTPLLVAHSDDVDAEDGHPVKRQITPLPKVQLALICLVRIAEPIAFSQVFPYVNEMCLRMGFVTNERDVGFVSGLIDSVYAFVQIFCVIHWGRLSDRIGRKPVLLFGLCGTTIAILIFGLSRRLWVAILARCLAGGLSGNGAVIQSMISEITDDTNEAQAFPLYILMWSLGSVIGPTFGGILARPADRFPGVFGGVAFWETYPYFLPCAVAGAITIFCMFMTIFLKETLPSKVRKDIATEDDEPPHAPPTPPYETMSGDVEIEVTTAPTSWEIVKSPAVQAVLTAGFLMMLINECWDVVFVLYSFTRVKFGGLSLSTPQIGYVLAGGGVVGAIVHTQIFPRLQRRFGIQSYPWLNALNAILFMSAPLLNFLIVLGRGDYPRGEAAGGTFVGAGAIITVAKFAEMVFPLNMILVKRAAPNKQALGSTYGVSQTVLASARAVSPWFVSSLFAFSVNSRVLGAYFVWVVMLGLTGLAVWQSTKVEKVLRETKQASESRTPRSD